MKYINVDKLLSEIERRIDSWSIRGKNSPEGQGKDTCVSRVTELSDLLSFINSLQQEQSEINLEKEIEVCWETYLKDAFGMPIEGRITKYEVEEIARHFYALGINA